MATPVYQAPNVQPSDLPGVQARGIDSVAFENRNADALGDVGKILTRTANDNMDVAAKQTMMANQVRVDAALNQVRAAQQHLTYDPANGYLTKKGAAAIEPNDQGLRLDDDYVAKLQSTVSEASSGLANEAQRRVFQQHANQMVTSFSGQLQAHVLDESKTFGLETQQGTIELARQTAIQSWNNPENINAQVESAKAAVWKAGQISGTPANLTAAKMNQAEAQIHSDVIKAALDSDNPMYAMAYLNAHKDQLGSQLLSVYGQVNRQVQSRAAAGAAQYAGAKMHSELNPSDFDRMVNITSATESGNNPNAKGPYIPGQGNAQGAMQVMPATGVDPGFGVTPAKDNSQEEVARVGRDYLAAMVKKYGDPLKAWAAYNAGPTTVDDAIAKNGGNWLANLPKETQDYVRKNNDAFNSGGGRPPIPSQQDFDAHAIAALGPNPDPELVNMTLNETKRQYAEAMNQRKTDGQNAVQEAQQWLIQNGGDFAGMPSNLKNTITSMAPDKYDDIQTFAKHVAQPPLSDNMAAYHTAISHPEELASMPDATFQRFVMSNFGEATQKQLAKTREDYLSGKTDNSAQSINTKAFNDTLNNRLLAIGIDPKPKHDDESGRQRVGVVQKFLTDAIYKEQQQIGRKMSPEETTNFIDKSFAKNIEFRNAVFGIPYSNGQMPLLQMKVDDIPSNELDQVKTALANKGVTEPTNDQIMRTYWNVKSNANQ